MYFIVGTNRRRVGRDQHRQQAYPAGRNEPAAGTPLSRTIRGADAESRAGGELSDA